MNSYHKTIKAIVFLAFAGSQVSSFAWADYDKTIRSYGAQQTQTGYFYINESWSQNCVGNIMYIDLSTPAGKAMFAEVMSAKLAGKGVRWVNYDKDANTNICYANVIEFQF